MQPAAIGGFDDATAAFLDCLGCYRGCSVHTVKAHARDLRGVRHPHKVTWAAGGKQLGRGRRSAL